MAVKAHINPKNLDSKPSSSPYKNRKATQFNSSCSNLCDRIMHLQRTIGNHAVGQLLSSGFLQAKLRIGRPNDKYEQEADREADQIMRMPQDEVVSRRVSSLRTNLDSSLQRQLDHDSELEKLSPNLASGTTKNVEGEQADDDEFEGDEIIQAKAKTGPAPKVTPIITHNIQTIRGTGQPLPTAERAFEPRFGRDLSGVRMHTSDRMARTAKSLNARAFTLGSDVVFAAGQYSPETSSGRRLLAHELVHVQQQIDSLAPVQIQRIGTDNCALTAELVDEPRDELARAARIAHSQIKAIKKNKQLLANPAIPRQAFSSKNPAIPPLIHLQHTLGNQALQRLLHAKTTSGKLNTPLQTAAYNTLFVQRSPVTPKPSVVAARGGRPTLTLLEGDMRDVLLSWRGAVDRGVHQLTTQVITSRLNKMSVKDWEDILLSLLGNIMWASAVLIPAYLGSGLVVGVSFVGIGISAVPKMLRRRANRAALTEIENAMGRYFDRVQTKIDTGLRARAAKIMLRYPGISRYRALAIWMPRVFPPKLVTIPSGYTTNPTIDLTATTDLVYDWGYKELKNVQEVLTFFQRRMGWNKVYPSFVTSGYQARAYYDLAEPTKHRFPLGGRSTPWIPRFARPPHRIGGTLPRRGYFYHWLERYSMRVTSNDAPKLIYDIRRIRNAVLANWQHQKLRRIQAYKSLKRRFRRVPPSLLRRYGRSKGLTPLHPRSWQRAALPIFNDIWTELAQISSNVSRRWKRPYYSSRIP